VSQLLAATVQGQDFILLHELAHYFQATGFTQSDADVASQKRNNDMVWEKCQRSVGGGPLM
jgi:N-acetylglutamate synthase-like GNAT family acetyltransferase